eukprot:SAG31_NODE_6243_length_2105_cov_1.939681_3_plen_46_part_01
MGYNCVDRYRWGQNVISASLVFMNSSTGTAVSWYPVHVPVPVLVRK